MKYLPTNLQTLTLNIYDNYLGLNIENMKIFGNLIKNLPDNLQKLELYLANNSFG